MLLAKRKILYRKMTLTGTGTGTGAGVEAEVGPLRLAGINGGRAANCCWRLAGRC
jgi:hypothetical protein